LAFHQFTKAIRKQVRFFHDNLPIAFVNMHIFRAFSLVLLSVFFSNHKNLLDEQFFRSSVSQKNSPDLPAFSRKVMCQRSNFSASSVHNCIGTPIAEAFLFYIALLLSAPTAR